MAQMINLYKSSDMRATDLIFFTARIYINSASSHYST